MATDVIDAVFEGIERDASGSSLTLEGTVDYNQVSEASLFGGLGYRFRGAKHKNRERYLRNLEACTRFLAECYRHGNSRALKAAMGGQVRLTEAMVPADFPLYFGDILDRQMLGRYAEYPPVWKSIFRQGTVSDFRTKKIFAIDGLEGQLNKVGVLESYPEAVHSESKYSYAISKYGRKTAFAWETMVDDDLDGLKAWPDRLARGARRTEQKFASGLYLDANGPHASVYTSGNANIINTTNGATQTNPPLNILGLQDGFSVLANQKDADTEPIMIEAVVLVVPPALENLARNILNAEQLWLGGNAQTSGGGSAGQMLQVNNWMRQRTTIIVDPYIPIIVTTSTRGNTTWALFAATSTPRPAGEVGFLRGYESPQLFMKTANQTRVGGGANAMDGDFDNDAINMKVRHCFGGTIVDARMSVGSNGTGS